MIFLGLSNLALIAVILYARNTRPRRLSSRGGNGGLQASYRLTFPDLLDLMVVCVDAGLGLEAALERISSEITRQNKALGINLVLMGRKRAPDAARWMRLIHSRIG